MRASRARQQRTEQQHRAAQTADQRAIRRVGLHVFRAEAQRRRADAVDLDAEIKQQPGHHLDVADARHVGERALVLGQQACGQQRQRGVLVAFHRHAAAETMAAFNQESGHLAS